MDMQYQNGFSILLAVLVVAVISVAFIAGYFLFIQNSVPGDQVSPIVPIPASQPATAGWNTLHSTSLGFQLEYPNAFFDAGHEPKVFLADCNYQVFPDQCPSINVSQSVSAPSKLTINAINYCLYQAGDAGAGNQYYYDYYVTVRNQKCLVIELDTHTVTCENYLPLESGNTQQAQNYNDCISKRNQRTTILGQIANTFTLTPQ